MPDDVRFYSTFVGHPKTRKLYRRLGAEGCWALVKLLIWTGENRPDGSLAGLADEDLELAVDWPGETPLVPVLCEVGFLDGQPSNYQVHDWNVYQPFAAGRPERIRIAREAAHKRWAKTTPEERSSAARTAAQARWSDNTREAHAYEERASSVPSMQNASNEHASSVRNASESNAECVPPPTHLTPHTPTTPTLPPTQKPNTTPLTPLSKDVRGETVVYRCWGTKGAIAEVLITAPKNRRLFTATEKELLNGKRADEVAAFFRAKGFDVEVRE
jgi:hypothetical protein